MESLGNSVSRGQCFTSWRVSHSSLHDALTSNRKTFPIIRMSFFTINYFHSIVGYNPCPTILLHNVLEDIKKILAYSATKESPVTVSQLYKMYNYFRSKTISLSNLQTIAICVLSFMGFLPFSEVIKLRRCDIIIKK